MVALQWTCLASPSFASTNKGHSIPMKNERQMDNLLFRRDLNIRLGVAFEDRPGCVNTKLVLLLQEQRTCMIQWFMCSVHHVNIQENASPFQSMVNCALPLKLMERIRMNFIPGLNRKPLYFDVTIAYPTSSYLIDGLPLKILRYVIKEKEKLKYDNYAWLLKWIML